jgi:glycosyltransferase involved in cell wall biosynthesis
MIGFEIAHRTRRHDAWKTILERNTLFQARAISQISRNTSSPNTKSGGGNDEGTSTLFSYSGAARELFRVAKQRGWKTVLGQIDPGPEEERIVIAERERYGNLATSWNPAPETYWENWRSEVDLADRIIVNSEWSRQCLLTEGVPEEKMSVVPLVYEGGGSRVGRMADRSGSAGAGQEEVALEILFLGQINLRKGVGRLLEAMRLLKEEAISLTLAGPAEIDPSAWAHMPNVKWVGPVARSEVGRYYAAADLFVLPTISDGYALTQLEALSHGLAVLASKSCGAAVTHGVNGWLLDDLEPATIARAILKARNALPLAKVEIPAFGLNDLAAGLAD